ncbi:MAG: hypothetical protein V3R84_02920 [Acidimicrobiia bacterium]
MADSLGDRLEALANDDGFEFELSTAEARCWGAELADEIDADRWEETGDPVYDFPRDVPRTEADVLKVYAALQRCVDESEVLRRMIVNFQPAFSTQELDCLVDGLTDAAIGPSELSDLRQTELTEEQQANETAAIAIDERCAPGS